MTKALFRNMTSKQKVLLMCLSFYSKFLIPYSTFNFIAFLIFDICQLFCQLLILALLVMGWTTTGDVMEVAKLILKFFFVNAPSSDKTIDFDLFNVIVNAVNTVKTRPVITSLSSKNTKIPNIKNPCGICRKSVNKNQKAIFCNACFKWIHRKCNGISLTEYDTLVLEDDDIPWQCILCEIAHMASKFPFGYLAKVELNDLYGLDLPSQLQLLPSHKLRSKLSHIPSLDNFNLDENYVQTINSKYVDLPNFARLHSSSSLDKAFSLFHVNTRSLSKTLINYRMYSVLLRQSLI